MATIREELDIKKISLDNVEYAGYSKESNWLYVRLRGDEYYFVTENGNRIQKGKQPFEKALDSSEANDKLDHLISDASDGN
jgi:molybdate-binding protein